VQYLLVRLGDGSGQNDCATQLPADEFTLTRALIGNRLSTCLDKNLVPA